jgi:hypothetical protein
MSHLFPFDLNNNKYDFAKCYNAYENVEGVSSSKHVPWKSSDFTNEINTSSTNDSCTNSMVKCRSGNLIDNDPYGVITNTNRECAAPPNYKYYNNSLPEMVVSYDKPLKKYQPKKVAYNDDANVVNNDIVLEEPEESEEPEPEPEPEEPEEEPEPEPEVEEEAEPEEVEQVEDEEIDNGLVEQFKEFFRTRKGVKGSKIKEKAKKAIKKLSKKLKKNRK